MIKGLIEWCCVDYIYPLFAVNIFICYFVVDVDRALTACAALSSFVPPGSNEMQSMTASE